MNVEGRRVQRDSLNTAKQANGTASSDLSNI